MKDLPRQNHPNLLVGTETSDDAGVYQISDDMALVQTLDFFTPIVDDPFHFGRIAAANSLSDVYAMGGRPLTAMNIVCFPIGSMPKEVLKEILRGGMEKVHEAGAVLVGGHSVDDQELKFGLSVTGIVHPKKFLANVGARVGDQLILTKPIGTGILATAVKGKLAGRKAIDTLIEITSTLNRRAAEVMLQYDVHACTDVTGFGLGGHILEMARGSHIEIAIHMEKVPAIPEALEYAAMGLIPAGSYATKHYCEHMVAIQPGVETRLLDLLFDPQTSGGLVIALSADEAKACLDDLRRQGVVSAAVIGEVVGSDSKGKLRIDA
jgi:selenide, water dikinase